MTNLEYIRKCDKGELAKLLCTIASPKHTVNCENGLTAEFWQPEDDYFCADGERKTDGNNT